MILYSHPELSPPTPCPYLPGQTLVYSFFFADSLSAAELSWFLSRGWRKFGHYFFRPACPDCRLCTPLRIPVQRFAPSRSQKRVLRRCAHMRVSFGPIRYEKALFDLYHTHSQVRFGQESSFDEFIANLHSTSCPTLLARYEESERLLGAGYLDLGSDGLSSVYFTFDPAFAHLSLGIFSVLREIEETRRMGLAHYYLGYVVPGCQRMAYKTGFHPYQLFSWESGLWHELGEDPQPPSPGTIRPFSGWTGPN
jgi:arginine-tRNA-protein transferase